MWVQFCKTKTKAQAIAAGNDGQIYFPTDEDCIVMGGKVYAHANAGTITGIKMNGSSKGTSGVVDLGNVITPSNINQSAAYQITLAGTPYEHSNGIVIITGANLISAIGNNPVARASSDASGHGIEATYATKGEIAAKQDAIQDLVTIRTNAQKALTAVQPTAINDMATRTWVSQQQYATVAQFNPAGGGTVETEEESYETTAISYDTITTRISSGSYPNIVYSSKVFRYAGKDSNNRHTFSCQYLAPSAENPQAIRLHMLFCAKSGTSTVWKQLKHDISYTESETNI